MLENLWNCSVLIELLMFESLYQKTQKAEQLKRKKQLSMIESMSRTRKRRRLMIVSL